MSIRTQFTSHQPHPDHPTTEQPTTKARNRWVQRGDPQKTLIEALHESYYVGCDELSVPFGKVRYHPPTETVLVIRQNHVTTVLNVSDGFGDTIDNKDHLVRCDNCDLEYQPLADNPCPWCDS